MYTFQKPKWIEVPLGGDVQIFANAVAGCKLPPEIFSLFEEYDVVVLTQEADFIEAKRLMPLQKHTVQLHRDIHNSVSGLYKSYGVMRNAGTEFVVINSKKLHLELEEEQHVPLECILKIQYSKKEEARLVLWPNVILRDGTNYLMHRRERVSVQETTELYTVGEITSIPEWIQKRCDALELD